MTSRGWWSRGTGPTCVMLVLAGLALAQAGCGGGGSGRDAGLGDAATQDGDVVGDLGVPLPAAAYLARHDGRRCPSPNCGGYFLQAVNQADTLCADGTRASECYVADLDWAASGLSPADQQRATSGTGGFLLDGVQEQRSYGVGGVFGVLRVSAAWVSEWGTPLTVPALDASFHQLSDNGMLCVLEPCFNLPVVTLNTQDSELVSALDLTGAGASGAQEALGRAALEAGTLRATGTIMTDEVAGPGGFGETYRAQQFYLRLPLD
ncbi:MAG: hypothetical protein IPL19_20305 [Sandaracinaceae bacterium]|nr:hypothetical protein [Sandaracinaceae bacterium]